MLAVDLAAHRPEAVSALGAAGPVRHLRRREPRHRPLRRTDTRAHGPSVREGRARAVRRAVQPSSAPRRPVARYLSDVAAANLLWPLGDRGQAHACTASVPRLSLWGEQDELLPPGGPRRWAEGGVPAEVIDGAGPSARVGRARGGRCPRRGVPRARRGETTSVHDRTGGVDGSRRRDGVPLLPLLPVHRTCPPTTKSVRRSGSTSRTANYDPKTGSELYNRYLTRWSWPTSSATTASSSTSTTTRSTA